MVAKTILCAALLLCLSTQAHALCRDDLADVKTRIDRLKTTSPPRYALALKWWGRAVEAEPGSEVECLNFLAMARKAVSLPLVEIADCVGPNAYLPNCHDGNWQTGFVGQGPAGPVVPIDGGGGNGVAPVAPVTQGGGNTSFGGAGSPGGGGNTQATGQQR